MEQTVKEKMEEERTENTLSIVSLKSKYELYFCTFNTIWEIIQS